MTMPDVNPVPRSLLLADDEPAICRSLESFLGGRGFRVSAVTDGSSALRALATGSFDIVLLDVNMPGTDGVTLAREARRHYAECRIVLITGLLDTERLRADIAPLGAVTVLSKPFHLKDLVAALEG